MRVLAFDTAMGACSVAIMEAGEIIAHHFEEQPKGHAETLIPAIQRLLKETGLQVAEFDRIGVTAGPGTFTGVRVGLATARALVMGTQVSTGSVSTLQALAKQKSAESNGATAAGTLIPVCDARRGEVYIQAFSDRADPIGEPAVMSLAAAAQFVNRTSSEGRHPKVFGSGAELISAQISQPKAELTTESKPIHPDAKEVASLVMRMDESDLGVPSPIYLRAPDAKLPAQKR